MNYFRSVKINLYTKYLVKKKFSAELNILLYKYIQLHILKAAKTPF